MSQIDISLLNDRALLEKVDAGLAMMWKAQMDDFEIEYSELRKKALTDASARVYADRIAKAFPIIATGFVSAIAALEGKDYMGGSAGLANICSGFGMLITPPQGPVIGTLLTLGALVTQQPSLEDKIKKQLEHLRSEQYIDNIRAVGHSISSYTNSLITECVGVHKMERPVVLDGTVSVTSDSKDVTGKGTTFTQNTEVGQWLLFDSDTSRKLYNIDAIGNDTSLTLTRPYVGASAAATGVKLLRRTTERRGIDDILTMPLTSEDQDDEFIGEMDGLMEALRGARKSSTSRFSQTGQWQGISRGSKTSETIQVGPKSQPFGAEHMPIQYITERYGSRCTGRQ